MRVVVAGVLDAIPVRVFWKDTEGTYLGCNTMFANDAGFADSTDVVGKTDDDMSWHDQAELYRADDLEVLASGQPKPGHTERARELGFVFPDR